MTNRDRILHALQRAGSRGCTTAELCQPDLGGVRFGARIKELRDDGHTIVEQIVRKGSHRYVLVADKPAREQAAPDPRAQAYTRPNPVQCHEVLIHLDGPHGAFSVTRYVGRGEDGFPDVRAAEAAARWTWVGCWVTSAHAPAMTLREAA